MNVHFIAIGGAIMHQLAIALHRKGYKVSGSDDAIYDPALSNLKKENILPIKMGYTKQNITIKTNVVILGMHAKKNNPELIRAQEMNIPIYSFPAFIYQQAKNKKRVVIAGSHGKTTITSMIMHVLKKNKIKFDFLVGAHVNGFEYSVKITEDAPLMIIEGDEYLSSPIDAEPKFTHYKADIALLSGIAWDHINVFPTQDIYIKQFEKLFLFLNTKAKMIAFKKDKSVINLVKNHPHIPHILYDTPDYVIENGSTYIKVKDNKYPLSIFGKHNLENIKGAQYVCMQLGIGVTAFYNAIKSFKGASNRLEKIPNFNGVNIYKDFAHSPSKLSATTTALKEQYPTYRLIACMELHTYSSLTKKFLPQYKHSMKNADLAIVYYNPLVLSKKKLQNINPQDIIDAFDHPNLSVYTDTSRLLKTLSNINYKQSNLLLMSSGNFGGLDYTLLSNEIKI